MCNVTSREVERVFGVDRNKRIGSRLFNSRIFDNLLVLMAQRELLRVTVTVSFSEPCVSHIERVRRKGEVTSVTFDSGVYP